ncbi:tautomerase family protein [Paraburkholderia sp. CNPSo 3076]|uniref:tautomerase family protein n=1 Tax=Paraburkholderia sp. CNPSo 3076 TaxID=2940936 RepID=UPI00225BB429|nr:tautomerase family protein [Paraburkholderia sp. CNPSo 3076]MCX5542485.1 tautomerase family protein [Paraburkholderia sp. CNPSo 3076]
MPMLKFDIIEGRTDEQVRALLDAAHEAMVQAFDVPATDRYQSVSQHRPGELVVDDTGLGYTRSKDVILLTAVSRKRTEPQKVEFYRLLVENLQTQCGISPDDVIVSIVENDDADWSFGRGRAQFITRELT